MGFCRMFLSTLIMFYLPLEGSTTSYKDAKCLGLFLLNGCFKIQVMVTVWRLTQTFVHEDFLCVTRAQRDGSWDLHLYYFKRMLPFLFRYDHVNYAIWVTVYLADMLVLPPEVLHEFQEGNVEVKRADRHFNQVSADRSTKWLNAI